MANSSKNSQGALEELANAIKDLLQDLANKSQRANDEYQQRSDLHDSEVKRLGDEIDSANYDISSTTEFLQNVLYVQRGDLEASIAELEKNIDTTGQYIEDEIALREQQHHAFIVSQGEHQDAIEAINECIELLTQLHETGELSLAQVKNVKAQFKRVQSKLGKNADATLVETLVQLGTEEFANSEALGKVEGLLNDVRANLMASMVKGQEEEEASAKQHEEDIKNKKAEINSMIIEKTDVTGQLERTNEQISSSEDFLAERQQDLVEWNADLDDENDRFQLATDHFNELIAQLNKEIVACEEALELIENAGLVDYIEDRTDMDVVIDRPHDDVGTVSL